MIFSSPKFILLFLPIAFLGYFYLNRIRLVLAGKAWLVAVSLFFYAYWNIAYLPLLVGSILFNFAVGTALAPKSVKACAVLAPSCPGMRDYRQPWPAWIFQVCRLSDRQHQRRVRYRLYFASPAAATGDKFLYIHADRLSGGQLSRRGKGIRFPQLCAVRHFFPAPHSRSDPAPRRDDVAVQIALDPGVRYRNIALGLFIFSIGLFKKVVIADTFAVWANAGLRGRRNARFFQRLGDQSLLHVPALFRFQRLLRHGDRVLRSCSISGCRSISILPTRRWTYRISGADGT